VLEAALEAWAGAVWLRESPTAYLFVNAAHILGIGLLIGAVVPLDLRLLGFFRGYALEVLRPFLTRAAATGIALAVITGLWLFSVKPGEYWANEAFRWKLALLALALANVVIQHRTTIAEGSEATTATRVAAGLSLGLWLAVLVAGRWIGFL
jgi:hypothetical protein